MLIIPWTANMTNVDVQKEVNTERKLIINRKEAIIILGAQNENMRYKTLEDTWQN
uniref:Uncharacterized protein n=1 Tax=Arion vulgaris TaxID=1028688 RepID=A0A0B6YSD0_9EUPU